MANKFECNPRRAGKEQQEGMYALAYDTDKVEQPAMLFRVRAAWRKTPPGLPESAKVTHHTTEVFVLAPSAEDATCQATCGLHLDQFGSKADRDVVPGSVVVTAERVPFFIRGWSDQEF